MVEMGGVKVTGPPMQLDQTNHQTNQTINHTLNLVMTPPATTFEWATLVACRVVPEVPLVVVQLVVVEQ